MRKVYRLKHVPTGLYWVKKGYGRLSENGSLFSTGSNSFNGMSPEHTISLNINDDKFIQKHMDVFNHVGELCEHTELKWDMKIGKMVPTGKTYFTWSMTSKVSDFVKEFVTSKTDISEPSVVQNNKEIIDDVTRVIVERVTRVCWDQMFTISKDLMSYEDLLERVKSQLNIK